MMTIKQLEFTVVHYSHSLILSGTKGRAVIQRFREKEKAIIPVVGRE